MVYYKDLQTNEIITFDSEASVGTSFYDISKYLKLENGEVNAMTATSDLLLAKKAKIQAIIAYWDNLRKFNIHSGVTLPCKADQTWFEFIQNSIAICEEKYRIGEVASLEDSFYVFDVIGSSYSINIPYTALLEMRGKISITRRYCAVNSQHHQAIVNSFIVTSERGFEATLDAINSYNFAVDFHTKTPGVQAKDVNRYKCVKNKKTLDY